MRFIPIRLFPHKTSIDFMGKRWIGFTVSIVLTLATIGLLATKGLNWGIDFTGGVLIEVRTEEPADLARMREALSAENFGEVSLQNFGDERSVIIRIQTAKDEENAAVIARTKEAMAEIFPTGIEYRKVDYVGPTVGQELIRAGIYSVLLGFLSIMLYVWFRFEWQYGLGAILALLHDTIMTIGFFSISGFEFGLTAIAALLTIIGYSINDSVVIYDRIRENMRRFKKMPTSELLNVSINETLSRTVMTAATTLLASLALALFGGEVLAGFSWAMVFGVLIGTYSSIYISAPALIYLRLRDEQTEVNAKAAMP